MRSTFKASTLESKFPILEVEHDCIISKEADVTVAFRVTLPEVFSVSSTEYEARLRKKFRLLPVMMKN